MKDKKGIAVAIGAAVSAYLQGEGPTAATADARLTIQGEEPATAAGASPWKLFGRQELMRTRGLWRSSPRVKEGRRC